FRSFFKSEARRSELAVEFGLDLNFESAQIIDCQQALLAAGQMVAGDLQFVVSESRVYQTGYLLKRQMLQFNGCRGKLVIIEELRPERQVNGIAVERALDLMPAEIATTQVIGNR
ncbi:MAG: hypothetical protein J2P31_16415, partial [Blastocatellia bacterium]|nr:hypothetical protein [Blastocatellia bacterium]